jgi:hypothetical protein
MKAYGVMDVQIHILLTSALVGVEWLASRPGRFTTGTHWIGGSTTWRKFLTLQGLELRLSVVQPVASRYTD